MAEARREIATALKLHRASTRERQQNQKQHPYFEPEGRMKSRRNPRIYPGCSLYLDNPSDFSHVSSPSPKAISLPSCPVPPTPISQNLNIEFPIQTLGLNLNFLDSNTVDTTSVVSNNSHSFCSLSFLPPSSYLCPPVSCAATRQEVVESVTLSEGGKLIASSDVDCSNFPSGKDTQGAVEEKEAVAEKAMEIHVMKALEIDGHHSFDKAVEFPDWLSINDDFLQQHSNHHCAEDYVQDPDLSW